jgi:hypothetical protein
VIAVHRPLLNRRGKGYAAEPPPQLRAIGPYQRERAWWLFHVTWLAVLTRRPSGWIRRSLAHHIVAADDQGWPVPLGEGNTHSIRIPTEQAAREMLIRAASPSLRDAVITPTQASEATAWWAGYAGHPFLANPQSTEVALSAVLGRSNDGRRGPWTLPSRGDTERLIRLVRHLGVSH